MNKSHTVARIQVASLRLSRGAGLCGCYCGSDLEVRSGEAILRIPAFRECQQRDPKKYRDFKVAADLSRKRWEELQKLVDPDALLALPRRIGCASCVDSSDDDIEVTFSDGSKKSVTFPTGQAPKEIQSLSEKLSALEVKLENELPVGWNR